MARARTFPLGLLPPSLVGKDRIADTSLVAGRRPVAEPRVRPLRNLIAPVIVGTPTIGQTLTSSTLGSWSGDLPISFARQWLRDGVPISGATSDSILLSVADFGANITCRITATNPLGSVAVESNALGPIAAVLPSNVVAPVVSGTPTEDETLSCTTGSWSGTMPITFSFQWRRDGSPIGGATSTTYVLQATDVGALVDCVVTATNVAGSTAQDSNDVGPIAASGGVAPTITVAPVLAWTVAHGSSPTITEGTYTGDAGTWTYDLVRLPSTTVLSGVSKATVEAYVADRATDIGPDWKVTGTITNGSGSDSADSNLVAYTPAVIPNLRGWYRADTVTLVGSDVDSWDDLSGIGNHLPAVVAGERPAWVSSGFNGGSRPYVENAAGSEMLLRSSFSHGASVSQQTVWQVAQLVGGGTNTAIVDYGDLSNRIGQTRGGSSNFNLLTAGGTGNATSTATSNVASAPKAWGGRWISNGNQSAFVGASVEDTDANTRAAPADSLAFGWGGQRTGTKGAGIRCAEMAVFARSITDAEVADLSAYATWRYGV